MTSQSWRGRMLAFACLTLALVLAALVPGVQAAPPPVGMPVQLAPPNACYSTTAAGGCSAFGGGHTIDTPGPIAISGDGVNVYAGGDNGGGVAFSRDASGALSAIGGAGGFAGTTFAIDGAGLFVSFRDSGSNNGEVASYSRGADGTLSFVNNVVDSCPTSTAHCANNNGLYDVEGVAAAPGGTRVYAASQNGGGGATGGALTVFSRNPATQSIALLQCVPQTASSSGPCSGGSGTQGLGGAEGIALSPDGKFLYASGYSDGAVMGFNLVQSGPNAGTLGSVVNCLWAAATSGCTQTPGLSSANGLALSLDPPRSAVGSVRR